MLKPNYLKFHKNDYFRIFSVSTKDQKNVEIFKCYVYLHIFMITRNFKYKISINNNYELFGMSKKYIFQKNNVSLEHSDLNRKSLK